MMTFLCMCYMLKEMSSLSMRFYSIYSMICNDDNHNVPPPCHTDAALSNNVEEFQSNLSQGKSSSISSLLLYCGAVAAAPLPSPTGILVCGYGELTLMAGC